MQLADSHRQKSLCIPMYALFLPASSIVLPTTIIGDL